MAHATHDVVTGGGSRVGTRIGLLGHALDGACSLVLGALGVGYSFTLALLFLCATSAASALPLGPGAIATQAGAGAAVLIASGVGVSDAVGVALAVQAVGMVVGGSILVFAAAWSTGCRHRAIWSAAAAESRTQESNALAMWEDGRGPGVFVGSPGCVRGGRPKQAGDWERDGPRKRAFAVERER